MWINKISKEQWEEGHISTICSSPSTQRSESYRSPFNSSLETIWAFLRVPNHFCHGTCLTKRMFHFFPYALQIGQMLLSRVECSSIYCRNWNKIQFLTAPTSQSRPQQANADITLRIIYQTYRSMWKQVSLEQSTSHAGLGMQCLSLCTCAATGRNHWSCYFVVSRGRSSFFMRG